MKILVLHLSDIHLHPSGNACEPKFSWIAKAIQNEEVGLAAVIVAISGDVAFSGRASEYELAATLLHKLGEDIIVRTKVADLRFVFVPGNHDCNFDPPNSVRELVINGIRSGQSKDVDETMIACCADVQVDFFTFRDGIPTGKPSKQTNKLYWEYVFEKDDVKMLFRCYNTAWLSQKKETQGGLYYPQVLLGGSEPVVVADYIVSLFHHPYNWMPAATYRLFRTHIEETSDLILTGHEHEPDHYQKYSFTGEVNEYLEGAVFQEHDSPNRAGFHAVYVDLSTQRQRTVSFWWEDDSFVPTAHSDDWIPYKRGSRGGKRDFDLSEDFEKWLDDPGATYIHPAKPDLRLSDIFVFPNMKELKLRGKSELVYGSLVEGRDLLKTLGSKRRVIVFARQQAGKTTVSKVLFRDFYGKDLTPVLLSGDDIGRTHLDIGKFEDLVESRFQKQYRNPTLPKFQQLDRDKTVVIIDDFDHTKLNARGRLKLLSNLKERYERVIVLGDDVLKLEEIATGKESSEVIGSYEQFEIVQFGHLLRSKLIEQWYGLGSEFVSDPDALGKRSHEVEKLITSLLGKNYLPSYPVFVLTLIQTLESATQPHSSVGTYGSLYEALITQSLATRATVGNFDLKLAYLSELAFWMFSNQRKRLSEEDWMHFHAEYCDKYKIKPSREDLKREFANSGLVTLYDERHGFRHAYSYYYFVARYFRDNLSYPQVRELVANLCGELNKQENASIWLFLTHLSKDPYIVEVILSKAQKIFAEFNPATFTDDVKFLKEMAASMDKVVLHDKPFAEIKEDRLRKLDCAPEIPDDKECDEETDEALKLIAQLNTALRTLEVIGQLVKNFPGSLVGTDKHALVKECYGLGLRTIAMLLGLFEKDIDKFIQLVVDRVLERHPELQDRDEYRKRLKHFMFWMIEGSCFGLVKRISHAVGHSALGETYREVRDGIDSNAAEIIDISVKLDNLGFPDEQLQELSYRFKDNIFCDRLLRQLVVEHFYLFPTKESTKQKVCAALEIDIQRLRQIDEKEKDQKQVPQIS